jgi:hypothetical protein
MIAYRILILALISWSASLFGCSIDEFRNPAFMDCKSCHAKGGTCVGNNKFCVLPIESRDAGPDADSSVIEAGPDAHVDADGGGDQPCTREGAREVCYDGDVQSVLQQPCHAGTRQCQNGSWGPCEGQVVPEREDCDGIDDDCNGVVDDLPDGSASASCVVDSAAGSCAAGMLMCSAQGSTCRQVVYSAARDQCNGLDEDCDGRVDEDGAMQCYDAAKGCSQDASGAYQCQGICHAGTYRCDEQGRLGTECEGRVAPESEERCTVGNAARRDEDCDGDVDEGCDCVDGRACYDGPSETQGRGACQAGRLLCTDAKSGRCGGQTLPTAETCANQGFDDDCNGVLDDVPELGTSCAADSDAKGACKAGAVWRCQGTQRVCVAAAPGPKELCDGHRVDEDCDGQIDEDFMLGSDASNCGACNAVCPSGLSCCSGHCVDKRSSNSNCGDCDTGCATGSTCCSSACTDTKTDDQNCGQCGTPCGLLSGCKAGSCGLLK